MSCRDSIDFLIIRQPPARLLLPLNLGLTMARPFDDSLNYQQVPSSLSSQTSLAGGRVYSSQADGPTSSLQYDRAGASWDHPRLTQDVSTRKNPRPKLPKIKSSPSHGALAAARESHTKMHRRGYSATSPTSPTFIPEYLMQSSNSTVPASAHADLYAAPERKTSAKTKAKIKPLLRKFTSSENVSIDLSRSAAENEGLGIYSSSEITRPEQVAQGRGFHDRTTSVTSQFSTNTNSSNRPGAQFVHPMRQTPRPYTPPIANSYKTSLDSEAPTVTTTGEGPLFDNHSRQASSNTTSTPSSYAPLPSSRRPPPIHVRTGSATRLTSPSQSNLPGTPSSLRFNTDTISPSDMVSPTTRSSLESAFRKRSRSNTANTNHDPAIQAATVQQMRRQFQEKEAAKELKYQQAEARAQEKEARRQEKREDSERRISEKRERKRGKSNAASEKSSFMTSGEYPSVQMLHSNEPVTDRSQRRTKGDTANAAGKAARSSWSLFWFRFTTWMLKLKRTLSCSS